MKLQTYLGIINSISNNCYQNGQLSKRKNYFAKKNSLKTLFDIGDKNEGTIILCEVGPDYTCIATADEQHKLHSLRYFSTSLDEIDANELSLHSFQKLVVHSAYPEALIVPHKYFDEQNSKQWLKEMFGFNESPQFHNAINEWQVTVAYTLPETIDNQFTNAVYWHVYATALKNCFGAQNQINIHFSPKCFRVMVKKGSALQLCQTYPYTTPLDVIYYLLNICQKFNLSQNATHLSLSGLIEKDSALYKELHQYFSNLSFNQSAGTSQLNEDYPAHYFTSVYQLVACAL